MAAPRYEYKFVRVPVHYARGSVLPSAYQDAVHAHAAQGWRLVQMFIETPGATPGEYVLILERERE